MLTESVCVFSLKCIFRHFFHCPSVHVLRFGKLWLPCGKKGSALFPFFLAALAALCLPLSQTTSIFLPYNLHFLFSFENTSKILWHQTFFLLESCCTTVGQQKTPKFSWSNLFLGVRTLKKSSKNGILSDFHPLTPMNVFDQHHLHLFCCPSVLQHLSNQQKVLCHRNF